MQDSIDKVLIEPLRAFQSDLLQFLPSILTSGALLIVGLIAGFLVAVVMQSAFRVLRIDNLTDRVGFLDVLKKAGIREPFSSIASRVLGWLTVFIFALLSLRALRVPAADQLIERVFLYLPNVFVSALVLFIGVIAANFLSRAALIASVNAGVASARTVGAGVRLIVLSIAIAMSLEQLGIGTQTVSMAFGIAFGGVVAALAIAFGLGGRGLARQYLEGKLRGNQDKDDFEHL